MKQSFTSYKELLEEEARLKDIVKEANVKVENRFNLDFKPMKILGLLKGLSPFNKGSNLSSSGLGFSNLNTEEGDNEENKSSLIELSLDLAYQSVGLLFIKRSQKNKLNSEESSAKTSIKLILKSIVDNIYFQNKGTIVSALTQLINRSKQKTES